MTTDNDPSRRIGDYPPFFRGYAQIGYGMYVVGRAIFGRTTVRWDELTEDERCDWIETAMQRYLEPDKTLALRADDV